MTINDHDLVSKLGRKIESAMNNEDGDVSDVRQTMLDAYLGALTGREREGYSRYVTREVLEAVEWAMPPLMRIFFAGDEVVSFDPVGPEDEAAASQETEIVNYHIVKANGGDGFLAVHDFVKDALIFPTAYAKAYVESERKTFTHVAQGITAIELSTLDEDPDIEILDYDLSLIHISEPTRPY